MDFALAAGEIKSNDIRLSLFALPICVGISVFSISSVIQKYFNQTKQLDNFFQKPNNVNVSDWWRYDMERVLKSIDFNSEQFMTLNRRWRLVLLYLDHKGDTLGISSHDFDYRYLNTYEAYFLYICDNFDRYSNHQKELSHFIDSCCPTSKDKLKIELMGLSSKMCDGKIPGDGFFAAQMWLRNESLRDITLPSEKMLAAVRSFNERIHLEQQNSGNDALSESLDSLYNTLESEQGQTSLSPEDVEARMNAFLNSST